MPRKEASGAFLEFMSNFGTKSFKWKTNFQYGRTYEISWTETTDKHKQDNTIPPLCTFTFRYAISFKSLFTSTCKWALGIDAVSSVVAGRSLALIVVWWKVFFR